MLDHTKGTHSLPSKDFVAKLKFWLAFSCTYFVHLRLARLWFVCDLDLSVCLASSTFAFKHLTQPTLEEFAFLLFTILAILKQVRALLQN